MIRQQQTRRAAHTVEAAMVLSIVLLFIFAIFEYGRYIMTLQVVENAAREGARMAIAHTNDKVTQDILDRVTASLAGVQNGIEDLQISVGGQILRPQNEGEKVGDPLPDWTEASFTDGIALQITGNYRPILPLFLRMPVTIPIHSRSIMYSEGN